MSFNIDNDVKDRVRTANDIVDLVGSYTELRRQGRAFVARCPWHDDQRPSLQVNSERQTWKCWVCDLGGDVFSWVMQKEGVSFPEALRMLAERAGITLEPMQRAALSNASPESQDIKKQLYNAMAWVVKQYHQCYMESAEAEAARKYMAERGLSLECQQKFAVGYSPVGWTWLLDRANSVGLSPKTLEEINAVVRSEKGSRYDRFRGRIMFPIRDTQSRPIALGGRIVPGFTSDKEQAKYINSTETRLYSKSHQLYGLDLARDSISKRKQAVVVEGYTDVMMAHQHGLENVVAVCGTALGESHIRLLRRYCDSVVLLLDGDEAGQRRTNEILELFIAAQMDLRVLTLPDGLDPCDYLIKHGGDSLREMLSTAVDALEHKVKVSCSGFDPLRDTHRANAALEDILGTMARAPKSGLASNEASKLRTDQIISRLARQFGLEQNQLRDRLKNLRSEASKKLRLRGPESDRSQTVDRSTNAQANQRPEQPQVIYRYSELTVSDRELFEIMVMCPAMVPMVIERIPQANLGSEVAKRLLEVYMDIELAGQELDFASIMSAIEDTSLKSVLVSIEEEASRKAPLAKMGYEQRLQSLCEQMSLRDQRAEINRWSRFWHPRD